jgi:ferredoxin
VQEPGIPTLPVVCSGIGLSLGNGPCSVIPGTASVEEAEENALVGHSAHRLTEDRLVEMERIVLEMRGSLCSRCGDCEPLCSKSLPISWLFRDAYICNYPSETFETLDRLQYFYLHPWETAACASCESVTCECPHGIDIPTHLIRIHQQMLRLRDEGCLPPTLVEERTDPTTGKLPLKVIRRHVPRRLYIGQEGVCRFCLENAGKEVWRAPGSGSEPDGLVMGVLAGNRVIQRVPLRRDVGPGDRGHFSFAIRAPGRPGDYALDFILTTATGKVRMKNGVRVFGSTLSVTRSDEADPSPVLGRWCGFIKDLIVKRICRSCGMR